MAIKSIIFKLLGIKLLKDNYLKWLYFANPGMLNKGNIFAFDYAIKRLPSNNPILEIGSFCGLSTNTILYLLEKNKADNKFFTADKWDFEGYSDSNIGQSNVKFSDYKAFVKNSFIRNCEFFSSDKLPHTIESSSDEFFASWDQKLTKIDVFGRKTKLGGKFSMCYVDGNHTFEVSLRDFLNTDKNLEIGGFILFDDSNYLARFGCGNKLMKEVKRSKKYKLVMRNPNCLFQKIKP